MEFIVVVKLFEFVFQLAEKHKMPSWAGVSLTVLAILETFFAEFEEEWILMARKAKSTLESKNIITQDFKFELLSNLA